MGSSAREGVTKVCVTKACVTKTKASKPATKSFCIFSSSFIAFGKYSHPRLRRPAIMPMSVRYATSGSSMTTASPSDFGRRHARPAKA
jgi:hypothetical protein